MWSTSEENIDESIFHPSLGVFVSSDLLYLPYTPTENKLLGMIKNPAAKSSKVSDEDLSYLRFNQYIFPNLLGLAFGGIAAGCLWVMDREILKKEREENEKEVKQREHSKEEPKPAKEEGKAAQDAEEILNEIKLSRKRMKANPELQKFDYMRAAQTMAKEKDSVEFTLKKQGKVRYFAVFSMFFMIGAINGLCRSRINLYFKSKEYRQALKDELEAPDVSRIKSVSPMLRTIKTTKFTEEMNQTKESSAKSNNVVVVQEPGK